MERYRPSDPDIQRENEPEKKVRGRPFPPGNPGRPRGAKNRTTRLIEQMIEGEAESLTRKLLDLALAGNPRSLQFALDRLLPKRNGRPVVLDLPPVKTMDDVVAAMAAVTTAVGAGDISAEEAAQLILVLEKSAKALEARDLIARMEAVETRLEKRK
jgi:hypothetical protein